MNSTSTLRIKAHRTPWWDAVELLMIDTSLPDGDKISVVTGLTVTTKPIGEFIEPTCSLGMTAAQELMDSLWQCGLRPSEGSGSAGSLAATERHLKDMQTIAFKALDKVLT